ncbi:adenosine receptor A2b-like [Amphiura filiformis]|uniref:adenosine receptor A2b-like n=1 Tax=Amphiura filiformis TaxID=82378 RepID=UPI003B220D41
MEYMCTNNINNNTTSLEYVPQVFPWMQGVFVAVDIVIFLVATTGNILVIASVCAYRKLRTPTNIFVTSLSVADLFVSCISIPTDIALALGFKYEPSPWVCLAGSSLIMAMSAVSVLHLLVIAYDRYLAIIHPFEYKVKMTKWRISGLIIFAWSLAAIFGIAPFCGLNNMDCYNAGYCDMLWIQTTGLRVTAICLATVILILMSYMYFAIYKFAIEAHKQIEAAESIQARIQTGFPGISTNASKRAWEHQPNGEPSGQLQPVTVTPQQRIMKRDIRTAQTVALIMGCFVITWTPASVLTILDVFVPITAKVAYKAYPYQLIFFHMAFSNSAMNPIVYAFRNKDFKYMFLTISNKVFRCQCWNNKVAAAAEGSMEVASIIIPSIVVSRDETPNNLDLEELATVDDT